MQNHKRNLLVFLVVCATLIAGLTRLLPPAVTPRPAGGEQSGATENAVAHPQSLAGPANNAAPANTRAADRTAAPAAGRQRRITLGDVQGRQRVVLHNGTDEPSDADPQIERTTGGGYRIRIDIPYLDVIEREQDGETFAELQIPGFSQRQVVGQPATPFKKFMLPIPHNVTPAVRLASLSETSLSPVRVWPAQPPFQDAYPEPPRPPLQMDHGVYDSDALHPEEHIIGQSAAGYRNQRIFVIEVAPVRVRPLSREALVADHIELEITFSDSTDTATPSDTGTDDPTAAEQDMLSEGGLAKYMILMDDQFADNGVLAGFVEWKKRKGYDVSLTRTSDIDIAGAPTHAQIRDYLRALPPVDYPEYLLIIGDHTAANGVEGFYFSTYLGGWSDLYLSCRDGFDYYPDLNIGRLPAPSSSVLSNMLAKTLSMDRTPPISDHYQNVCIAGQIQDTDGTVNQADRLFCETADSLACYFEQDAAGVDYTCERAIVNPNGVNSNCTWNPASMLWIGYEPIGARVWQHFVSPTTARNRISANVNRGTGILLHRDHGYSSGSGWADPYYVTGDVAGLSNGDRLGAVFSINCASGAYQHDRFLRAWLQNPNGGAYAVFAPVDSSYSWHNDWLTQGFFAGMLPLYLAWHNTASTPDWPKNLPYPGGAYGAAGSAKRLGEVLNFGRMYYDENYAGSGLTTFLLFHCFGDPEAWLYIDNVSSQTVNHASTIGIGSQTVIVDTSEDDARVCLYSEELDLHCVTNARAGRATFDLNTVGPGTIHVTVSSYACRPYEGAIGVAGSVFELDTARHNVQEGCGSVLVSVRRTGSMDTDLSVDFSTADGTAFAGSDYVATNGTLTFAPGVASNSFVVSVIDDTVDESGETFSVSLSNPAPADDTALGSLRSAVVSVMDDDGAGEFMIAAAGLSADESAPHISIPVLRVNGSSGTVWVAFSTGDGTAEAGKDYVGTNGVLLFTDGMVSNDITILLTDDVQDEPNEQFTVRLLDSSAGSRLVAPDSAAPTIRDNDVAGTLALAAGSLSAHEANGEILVTLTRTGGSDGIIAVDFATSDGSARAGSDYTATNGTLVLDHNVAGATVRVALTKDLVTEPDETFRFTISNPAGGAVLGSPESATITLASDNSRGWLNLSPDAYVVDESNGRLVVTVSRTGGTTGSIAVDYATTDGTAVAGSDYVATNGTLTLGDGVAGAVLEIEILDDRAFESTERFNISLSNPTGGAALGPAVTASASIISTDGLFFSATMDSDPGWTAEGYWGFGIPLGFAGDPVSGHSGARVYGYNLAGAYTDNTPRRYLTTSAIDCRGRSDVQLRFRRWLGVEDSIFDEAVVEASSDGTNWVAVWTHDGGYIQDTEWVECVYDISDIADGQRTVFIRWGMGKTDISVTFSGWNLDDVELYGNEYPYLVMETDTITIPEGDTNGFTLGLSMPPDPGVCVTVTVARVDGDPDIEVAGEGRFLFDSDNWDLPRTVTLTAAEDADTLNGTATISCSAPGLDTVSIPTEELENDLGIWVSDAKLSVPEAGACTFQVRLSREPSSQLTVSVARLSGDDDIAVVDGASLVFLPHEWNAWKSVTLSAALDDDYISGTAVIRCASPGLDDVDVEAVEAETPRAFTPFACGFESGILSNHWTTYSTSVGRTRLTSENLPCSGSRHVIMDSGQEGVYSLNELVLTIDLEGKADVVLNFQHCQYSDEDNAMSPTFQGHHNADGVAISADGTNWVKVHGLTDLEGTSQTYRQFSIPLDATAAANGLTFNRFFKIKFQQYDNYPATIDGFGFDDISVTATDQVFALQATCDDNGTMSPAGSILATYGSDKRFSLLPNERCHVENVIVDGESLGSLGSYDLKNIRKNHSVRAVFDQDRAPLGTPELWLIAHGWTNNFAAAETEDPDDDGQANWQEYIGGSDPNDGASVFRISNVTGMDGDGFVVCWPGIEGRVYSLYRSTNLSDGFVCMATNIPPTPPFNTFVDPAPAPPRAFYRIGIRLD